MSRKLPALQSAVMLAAFAMAMLVLATTAAAQTEKILHNFNNNGKDGADPAAGLIFDSTGNLYGTTFAGGTNDAGTVYELQPKAGGGWSNKVLHSFIANGSSAYDPYYAGVTMDTAGNLYGTTLYGGIYGAGTVFELVRQANGTYLERVLHNFGNGKDGSEPYAGVILDAEGNVYGTTFTGGLSGLGMVFELTPSTGEGWKEKALYSFTRTDGSGGGTPEAALVFDSAGNLYGTTSGRLGGGVGAVFELKPTTSGPWTLDVLHAFLNSETDGGIPLSGLVFDGSGNLYGTTSEGGSVYGIGAVFELSPTAGGSWTETQLHDFTGGSDGCYPQYGAVVLDGQGNVYGTTTECGITGGGVVYELSPSGATWTEKILYTFVDHTKDGVGPQGTLVRDSSGNVYGTTQYGGTGQNNGIGAGTVFEITP
jgi:uncharacterized repeat protein (TIGR03803 family)